LHPWKERFCWNL